MAEKRNITKGRRPRTYATDFPVYDSIGQMASATGVPETVLKWAKKSGCLFVRHGRCHSGEFVRWFFQRETSDEDQVDWGKRDKRAAALTREANLEKLRESLIEWDVAARFVRYLVSTAFFGELDRMRAEFPASLKGKTEVEIEAELGTQIERAKENLGKRLDVWIKKKGKP